MNLNDHLDALEDLNHDLGKYICFESRFVDDTAPDAELRSALCTDVFETHRASDGVLSAWQVWQRLRPAALMEREEVRAIERALSRLGELQLRENRGSREELVEARALCREVAANTRSLLKLARSARHG